MFEQKKKKKKKKKKIRKGLNRFLFNLQLVLRAFVPKFRFHFDPMACQQIVNPRIRKAQESLRKLLGNLRKDLLYYFGLISVLRPYNTF